MSWLLFMDESGHDQGNSPYEVLAGVAVEDRRLWPLIQQLNDLQEHHFGFRRFRRYGDEAKARKLLKRKTYRLANQGGPIPVDDRRQLAQQALEDGQNATRDQLTALAQAKVSYCYQALNICLSFGCIAFASIVPQGIPRPKGNFLRKDYAFLFERFFHFLNSHQDSTTMGVVVFDELEKIQSHILIGQMEDYFVRTAKGRTRSRLIIPEPLFVHSDLTTMVQMADVVAYVISWGLRLRRMTEPHRPELDPLVRSVLKLRYHSPTQKGYDTWGFKLIESLLIDSDNKEKAM